MRLGSKEAMCASSDYNHLQCYHIFVSKLVKLVGVGARSVTTCIVCCHMQTDHWAAQWWETLKGCEHVFILCRPLGQHIRQPGGGGARGHQRADAVRQGGGATRPRTRWARRWAGTPRRRCARYRAHVGDVLLKSLAHLERCEAVSSGKSAVQTMVLPICASCRPGNSKSPL